MTANAELQETRPQSAIERLRDLLSGLQAGAEPVLAPGLRPGFMAGDPQLVEQYAWANRQLGVAAAWALEPAS